eukprot:m.158659 g.158659  ORF g.158659 m.158659 type:complete len:137 (+) comp10252_c0_seq1:417-827(+)
MVLVLGQLVQTCCFDEVLSDATGVFVALTKLEISIAVTLFDGQFEKPDSLDAVLLDTLALLVVPCEGDLRSSKPLIGRQPEQSCGLDMGVSTVVPLAKSKRCGTALQRRRARHPAWFGIGQLQTNHGLAPEQRPAC